MSKVAVSKRLATCCKSVGLLALCATAAATTSAEGAVPASNPFLPPGMDDRGWPSIRGVNYDGTSPEIHLADAWPASGPIVLWTKKLGQGYSAFVALADRVYTQYQTLRGQFVVCLDARTGQTVWEYRYDWPYDPAGLYPGPRSTPTLAMGRVYFATPSGMVGCLDRDGSMLWSENLKERYKGKGTDFGYSCSPTVVDGKVIMPVGGENASVVALDASSGKVMWTSGSASSSYTPAMPITVDGHQQIVAYLENELVCLDQHTGDQLWRLKLSSAYDEHAAWPIYEEPYLWFSGPFRAGSQLIKLAGGAETYFEPIWQSPVMSNDVASSVLVEGCLYGFDLRDIQSKAHRPSRGSFRCLDLLSGEQRWSNGTATRRRSRTSSDAAKRTDNTRVDDDQTIGQASILVADGKLILFNDIGELILAKVNPERYEELARATVLGGEICWTSPALHRGCLYLRNHSRVVCIYLGEPELLDRSAEQRMLTVSDIPQTAVHDLSSFLGIEPEYALDPPTYRWLWIWYGFSLGILFIAGVISALVWWLLESRMTFAFCRWLFWALVSVLGVALSRPLSLVLDDFVFTWPVSLFVAFQATVYQVRIRGSRDLSSRAWSGRLVALGFIVVSGTYYVVCRRLSLVTEWIFLCGFPCACPFVYLGYRLSQRPRSRPVVEFFWTVISFTVFFWSSVALLSLKYEIARS